MMSDISIAEIIDHNLVREHCIFYHTMICFRYIEYCHEQLEELTLKKYIDLTFGIKAFL